MPPNDDDRLAKYQVKRAATVAAIDTLIDYEVNRTRPFDTTPADLMRSCADQAHALCIVLGVSIDELADTKSNDLPLRPVHISRCIEAIGTLISLSLFASEGIGQ